MPTLDWIGKEAVVKHHKDVPYRLLVPVKKLSHGDVNSGNLIVQGDNLHALKALLPRYAGKVKCIYIDPPYNTGNESWVYNDNVNSLEIRKWLGEVVGKEAEDLSRHDKWLCMIYPRLLLLRQFLRDDGVIFVSMDDNEVSSLRMVMDEIFGRRNFVASFVWNTEGHTDNQFHVKVNHEYVLAYSARSPTLELGFVVDPNTREESNLWKGYAENSITKNGPVNPPSEVLLPKGFPSEEVELKLDRTNVPKGFYKDIESARYTSSQLKEKYDVEFPIRKDPMLITKGKLKEPCRVYSGWANVNKLKQFIENGCNPILEDDGNELMFFLKGKGVIYYRRVRHEASNILSVLRGFGTTEQMRSELMSMGLSFKYPKPKELIKYLVRVAGDKSAIVMDSFAGSGTTGHAVMELNGEDEGERKYILIEMDEQIAEPITCARLRKVCAGYKSNKGKTVDGLGSGFQYCRLSQEPLFTPEGQIRADVAYEELAEFVWFAETGTGYTGKAKTPLLGVFESRAIYLLFNGILKDRSADGGNVLTGPVYSVLPTHDGPKVIYGAACRLGSVRLAREGIVFKQTPYALEV